MSFRNCSESISLETRGASNPTQEGSSGRSPGHSILLCREKGPERIRDTWPHHINAACDMYQFIKQNNEKTPVSGLNQQFRLTPNNRDRECCIITAVCQETEHTCTLSTHKHNHTHVVYNNLKFPQTGVLLGGTNQLHLKHLKKRKLINNKKTLPCSTPPLSQKVIWKRRISWSKCIASASNHFHLLTLQWVNTGKKNNK